MMCWRQTDQQPCTAQAGQKDPKHGCNHSIAGLNSAQMSEAERKPSREVEDRTSHFHKTKIKRSRQVSGHSGSNWWGQVCGELWRSCERRLRRPAACCGVRERIRIEGGKKRLKGSCRVWWGNFPVCHYPHHQDMCWCRGQNFSEQQLSDDDPAAAHIGTGKATTQRKTKARSNSWPVESSEAALVIKTESLRQKSIICIGDLFNLLAVLLSLWIQS